MPTGKYECKAYHDKRIIATHMTFKTDESSHCKQLFFVNFLTFLVNRLYYGQYTRQASTLFGQAQMWRVFSYEDCHYLRSRTRRTKRGF